MLVFIFPGEPGQLGMGMLIVFAFLVMQLVLQPYATSDLNNMQSVSQISLMLTLLVGIMMVIEGYIARELEFISSGPWGIVDAGQTSLRELNRAIFSFVSVLVNIFTMCAPALVVGNRIYQGMGTREEVLASAKTQVNLEITHRCCLGLSLTDFV